MEDYVAKTVRERIEEDVAKRKCTHYALFESIWVQTRKERRTGKQFTDDTNGYRLRATIPDYVTAHYRALESTEKTMPAHAYDAFQRGVR
ncbi:MAG: hypothetical protein KBC38_03225 [Candidatus Pacebacteria bacterium]|nr:hypothetical protein [Candidatus Paceibacterota bacterium]MBP9840577.1 hypothetical protein [Candidatus Paceibacterota bacterium]